MQIFGPTNNVTQELARDNDPLVQLERRVSDANKHTTPKIDDQKVRQGLLEVAKNANQILPGRSVCETC